MISFGKRGSGFNSGHPSTQGVSMPNAGPVGIANGKGIGTLTVAWIVFVGILNGKGTGIVTVFCIVFVKGSATDCSGSCNIVTV